MGDWETERQHRYLVHFSDGGAGMRVYDRPPEVGDEINDGGDKYLVAKVTERQTSGGFGHVWVELRRE